jgi:hypothetical protein
MPGLSHCELSGNGLIQLKRDLLGAREPLPVVMYFRTFTVVTELVFNLRRFCQPGPLIPP